MVESRSDGYQSAAHCTASSHLVTLDDEPGETVNHVIHHRPGETHCHMDSLASRTVLLKTVTRQTQMQSQSLSNCQLQSSIIVDKKQRMQTRR